MLGYQKPYTKVWLVHCEKVNPIALLFVSTAGLLVLFHNDLVKNPLGIVLITFIQHPDMSRDAAWHWTGERISGISSAVAYANFPLASYYLSRVGRFKRNIIITFVVIGLLLVEILKASRVEFIMFLFCFATVYHYQRQCLFDILLSSAKMWVVVTTFLLLNLYISAELFHSVRSSRSAGEMSENLGMVVDGPPAFRSIVTETYTYFATPFQNHSRFVNSLAGSQRSYIGVGLLKMLFSDCILNKFTENQFTHLDLN